MRFTRVHTPLLFSGLLFLAACQGESQAKTPPAKAGAKKAAKKAAFKGKLDDPKSLTEKAPAKYAVKLETTKGDIIIDVNRAWAPNGADRFYNLVRAGFYNDTAFFRVIKGFMAQIGIHGDPNIAKKWRVSTFPDDPVKESNTRGMVTFATAGPNSRTTQFFINFQNNGRLDGMGFSPFGKVRDMKPVDTLNGEYGEGQPNGRGPAQGRLQSQGNKYLRSDYPNLDYIKKATILAQ